MIQYSIVIRPVVLTDVILLPSQWFRPPLFVHFAENRNYSLLYQTSDGFSLFARGTGFSVFVSRRCRRSQHRLLYFKRYTLCRRLLLSAMEGARPEPAVQRGAEPGGMDRGRSAYFPVCNQEHRSVESSPCRLPPLLAIIVSPSSR